MSLCIVYNRRHSGGWEVQYQGIGKIQFLVRTLSWLPDGHLVVCSWAGVGELGRRESLFL